MVAAPRQLTDNFQLILRSRIRHNLEPIRYDWQILYTPFLIFGIIRIWLRQAQEVSDRPCNDILLPLQVAAVILGTRFNDSRNGSSHVWLLRDNQCLHSYSSFLTTLP